MRLFIILSISCCICTSCDQIDHTIYYKYNNVIVTRIDKGNKAFFYYGQCNGKNDNCAEPDAVVDWSFDEIMDGYLLFHNDKTVEIINVGGGEFEVKEKIKKNIFIKNYENPELIAHLRPFEEKKLFNNLIKISNYIEAERLINKNNKSQVEAQYQ